MAAQGRLFIDVAALGLLAIWFAVFLVSSHPRP